MELHIADCDVERLTACKALARLTELRLQHNHSLGNVVFTLIAEAMPRLSVLDISSCNIRCQVQSNMVTYTCSFELLDPRDPFLLCTCCCCCCLMLLWWKR